MANQDILNSLSTNTQIPLDGKTYFKTLATLSDLGASDHLAFKYYENMVVQCIEDDKEYIWREWRYLNEPGLLPEAFEYPANSIVNGIDYSNRFFNFFEYQVFTDTQIDRLKDSVYLVIVQSISASPTTFEKGLSTNLVFTWNVDKKDDTLNICTVDSIDRLAEATGVNRTYNVANQVATKQVFLSTNVNRNNVSGGTFTNNISAASTALIPQYYGLLPNGNETPLTYALLNPVDTTDLKKWLSAVSAKTVVLGTDVPTPSNEHFFFLSTKSNAIILDVNGFNVTDAFTKTTVTMKLADGTDQSITQYKTTLTLNSTGTFIIN